jgi:hypothetical protein
MKPELRKRIVAFNKQLAQRKEKADDLDVLVAAILKSLPGQLKKVLTDDVLAVLAKYDHTEE